MIADTRDQLLAKAGDAATVGELFAAASERLRRLVPYDAAVWLATDPATGLPTCPTRTENLAGFSVDECLRGWELEFMVEDVNLYGVLARAPTPRPACARRPATARPAARATGR